VFIFDKIYLILSMIEIKDIHKEFEGRVILDGVSGVFKQGMTNMVIGGSGTGKSVLLKCMIGILSPEKGKVLYDGRDFVNADQETVKAIRREMGVLFQGGALFDSKTVLENVRFPLDTLTTQGSAVVIVAVLPKVPSKFQLVVPPVTFQAAPIYV
jgi:phospholipid/cholesterol/gamma-HCH transport system ATP-binding protein